ncbi:hypothetical protein HU200_036693 [Digitaria exilis]|uniref:Uncharacterized protein n=1 Tax=Digitaria exilis TaxID=1010633 RepID=A0A835BGH4_9POAL|nr:hypothetical protein HU200_036693 [Digitaria exilis]CAB3477747.1 unnamed protein product [Digitaria exilis]
MFNAMSALLSSLARRLVPLRRRKSITSSGFVATRRRSFFPCGAGYRDVVSGRPPLVVKRSSSRTLRMRKVKPGKVGERKRGHGDCKGDGDESCVWRRTILMGRRCQPLEFTGAIHYDCEGQRLWQPRTPPQSSPLSMSPARHHPSHQLGYMMDRA